MRTTSGVPLVTGSVLALSVFLIDWFRVDLRPRLARVLEVCVNVVNMHDQTSARLRQHPGGGEFMLG